MSDRERWTVYPLLFLALGLAMRAVLVPPAKMDEIDAVRVTCREIVVRADDGEVMLHLGRVADGGGRLEINDGKGSALMAIGSLPAKTEAEDRDEVEGEPNGVGPRGVIEFAGPDGEVVRRITPAGDESLSSP